VSKQKIIAALMRAGRNDLANTVARVRQRNGDAYVTCAGRAKHPRPARVSRGTPVAAGSWLDKAKAELEAELGGIEISIGRTGGDFFEAEIESGRADNGESSWVVYKNEKAAERAALERVLDDLNGEPETFNQKWLEKFVMVTPTDIRILSGEEGANYVEDLDDDRLLKEAKMDAAWQRLEDKIDKADEVLTNEMDPKKRKGLEQGLAKMRAEQDKLVDRARDKVAEQYADEVARQLKTDPVGWARDLGYDMGRKRPPWLTIDTKKAAADAIRTDGVAHFLDHYDGEEIELPSGAVAYGN
jgi:hypothetical protein